jgi:hypothetical protein
MTDPDNVRLRDWVARLPQMASEARATERHAVADQFTERAAASPAESAHRKVAWDVVASSSSLTGTPPWCGRH